MNIVAHIINHTHWDREWFLTSVYTSEWIPALIDKLEQLVANNPSYRFLLDGQTLVIEDLLKLAPDYRKKIERLVKNKHLIVGPYYCQPDWQITGGESLIRNLFYGWQDMQQYGGDNRIGWLVDTFGHISQVPQLHHMFDLEAVFVWRGVPRIEPYFYWQGADGHQLLAINLFGGYRNLYGVTIVPEVAIKRLETEISKLKPFYPTTDIPLFDGYDLEQNPEDPVQYYKQQAADLSPQIRIQESSPHDFVRVLNAGALPSLPVLHGELNSGKYGATFPGTLSTRTYIKVMNRDCEYLLYRLCEPLAALAHLKGRAYNADTYESWGRNLLQNLVHDCICGVSIDQVYDKMEYSYTELYQAIERDVRESLAYIFPDFAPGRYAVSTNAFAFDGWQVVEDKIYHLVTQGVGVWQLKEEATVEFPNQSVPKFEWQNDHFTALVKPDGTVQLGSATFGRLVVIEERGDAYSNEAGPDYESFLMTSPLVIEEKSAHHCVVRYECACQWRGVEVTATVRLTFDRTPLLRWQIDLDSRGVNFRVDMQFETAQSGEVYAGMPFDVVKRPIVDRDLLPRELDPEMAKVLLSQRELTQVETFPFHDFVAISNGKTTTVVLAKGLRAYQAAGDGTVALTLRRSVEWITVPDLSSRAGDAGPFMYVPDARCERTVRHEVAVAVVEASVDEKTIHQLNAGFQNPPLIVATEGRGTQTQWQVLHEDLPLSSLRIQNNLLLARFYNPTRRGSPLKNVYQKTDVWGNAIGFTQHILPKAIQTLKIEPQSLVACGESNGDVITRLDFPVWRVGSNNSSPDPEVIRLLQEKINRLEGQLAQVERQLSNADGDDRYILQHRYYVLKREQYELRLSVLLNQKKLAAKGKLEHEDMFTPDPEIANLGKLLNELRIKRRIFDYVIEAL